MNLSVNLPAEIIEAIAEKAAALVTDRLSTAGATADEWLDVQGAADYLKCEKSRVYALTSQGELPVFKDGSRSLYRRDDLREFVLNGGAKRA